MRYIGLIVGLVLGAVGMYKIDYVLYEGLNYFGKYVFFAMFNLFVLWLFWFFYKRFKGALQIAMPILFGLVLMLIGLKFM
ncbi:hypothetical protein [Caminibacter pacificus]